jgi:hypothetical protein
VTAAGLPALDLGLLLRLAAVLALFQGLCWLAARGLGVRLGRAAVLCGLLAPLVVLAPWLTRDRLLVPTSALAGIIPGGPLVVPTDRHELLNDTLYQLLPWELEIRHAFAERRLPFWSDSLEGGSSPWGNPQAGVLSPFAMAARIFPIQHHLLAALALKILVAFQGTWLLARLAGRSRAAALLAAAGFALGGGLFAWGLFPVSAVAALAPWLAAATVRLFRRPAARPMVWAALFTAAILLAGHPETALGCGLLAAACGLGLRRRAAPFWKSLGLAAGAAALGLMLAAPHLLPFLHLMRASQRAAETMSHDLPPIRVLASRPETWFLPGNARFALAPTGPHAFGRPYREPFRGPFNWADCEPGYTGLLAFAGAVAALFARRDRRLWPFAGFAAGGLLLAARFVPLAWILYAVPGLQVPAYQRFLVATSLALAVAGAFGVDAIRRRRKTAAGRPIAPWIGLGAAAAASLAVQADPWTAGLWLGLAAGFALLALRPRAGAAVLAVVLLTDLVPWSRSLLPNGRPALFYPRSELIDRLLATAGDPAEGRAVGAAHLLYASLLPVYGAADPRPHNPLAPIAQLRVLDAAFGFHPTMLDYFAAFGNVDHPLLDFLGVRAVVGSPAVPTPATLVDLAPGRYAPFALYRNPDALPRWFFPTAVDPIAREELGSWIRRLDAGSRVAVFRDEAGGVADPGVAEPGARAIPVFARPGRVVLDLPAVPGGTLLASSVPRSDGWRAVAAGQPLPIVTVDGAFLGVRIPAGARRVELSYLPPGLVAGCAVAALSALIQRAALRRGRRRPGRSAGGARTGSPGARQNV